jgi:aromatic-L-amino-acid decarboxylase
MEPAEFRTWAHQIVDWIADYRAQIERYPVRSQAQPGDLLRQLPLRAPEAPEPMEALMRDFEALILPGITHWQSPHFYAYFPANASLPSLLAEMLTAGLGAQCMIWETSPAAAELEERMMEWMGQEIGIPAGWSGALQSTASEATLCALLAARERASGFQINRRGFEGEGFRVYASSQTHSSIEKGVKIAGLGRDNLSYLPVRADFSLDPEALEAAIAADRRAGLRPLCVVATLGSTSTTAMDPLPAIAKICAREGIWLHVDAAYAGSAFFLPECRTWMEGIEQADSLVFNPHKWLFTHFDCSAFYVKDREALLRSFEIMPEYLKTRAQGVNNYRDWGIPLGRRFRALKLWFVLRSYGLEGIRSRLRAHMAMAEELERWVLARPDFERMAPRSLNLVCFRYRPDPAMAEAELDALNEQLLQRLNDSGRLYLTHTRLSGRYVLRMVIGQVDVQPAHVADAWRWICEEAEGL